MVHPLPGPSETNNLNNKNNNEGTINQNLKLFARGNTKSKTPLIIGTNQFPKTPIKIGIIIKKNY